MWVGAQMERKWSADNGMDSWPAPVSNEVMDWVQSVHTLHPPGMQLHRARILCPPHTNCHNCGPEEYNFWTIVQLGAVLL